MNPSKVKYLKVLLNLGIALAILLIFIFLVPKLIIYFMPFVVGWIISLIASPLVRFFEEKMKIRRKAGTAFVIVAVLGLIVLCGYFVGVKLIEQIQGFITALPDMWSSVQNDMQGVGQSMSVLFARFPLEMREAVSGIIDTAGESIGDMLSGLGTPTITAVGNFAKQLPSIIIGIIMCLLSAYFFVADKHAVSEWMGKRMPEGIKQRYIILKNSLVRAVGGYFKAQLKIEIWMYLLLVIGFSILGIQYSLLIALGIAILDFFPFFGTGTVMIPWAIIKFLSADYKMFIGLIIIWGVGQLARQLIQPKIVGDSIGVAPIPTLFFLFIGYKVGSVIGMILAVPIGIIIITMYEEGAFDTSVNSLKILVDGLNRFRKLEKEDMGHIVPHVGNSVELFENEQNRTNKETAEG